MPNRLLASAALAIALLAAACGSSSSNDSGAAAPAPGSGAGSATSAAASATTAGGSDSYSEYGGAYGAPATSAATGPSATAAATSAPAAGNTAGTVALGSTQLGTVLVDGTGMTLYAYMKDTQGQPSVCEGACAVAWPPLEATSVSAGSGVDASKLGTTTRPDGSTQVTYDGWPLYGYAKDVKPGDATGQGVGTVWYVLDASGNVRKG